jgi:hypothetical protein
LCQGGFFIEINANPTLAKQQYPEWYSSLQNIKKAQQGFFYIGMTK